MSEPLRIYESKGATSSWPDVPAGIRFSAIILVLLACAPGLCGLFCIIALVISLMHPGRSLVGVSLGLAGIVALAVALVCLRAAKALRNAQRWGANVATVCGGLAVAFGSLTIFDFFRVGGQSADEYFLYPVAPIFLVLGAWLCIYLNLPRVRSSFKSRLD
jgi:hypothetical protein